MNLSDSELKQLELLKKKTPAQRFMMMVELIGGQIEAMKAGIRYKNPRMTDEEVHEEFKKEMSKIYSIKPHSLITKPMDLRKFALRKETNDF